MENALVHLSEEQKKECEGKVLIVDRNTKKLICAVLPDGAEIKKAIRGLKTKEFYSFYYSRQAVGLEYGAN